MNEWATCPYAENTWMGTQRRWLVSDPRPSSMCQHARISSVSLKIETQVGSKVKAKKCSAWLYKLTLLTPQDTPSIHTALPRISSRQLRFWERVGWTKWCALDRSKQPRRFCTRYPIFILLNTNQQKRGRLKEKKIELYLYLLGQVFSCKICPRCFLPNRVWNLSGSTPLCYMLYVGPWTFSTSGTQFLRCV